MNKPLVIIGHRMGGGKNVALGVEKAGGTPYIIEGMAADMKLGEVMNSKEGDLGICFCGSGGAGAITAETEYGYNSIDHLRNIEEGETAIKEGKEILGFGFMDTEELGYRLTKIWKEKHEQ